MIKKYKRWIIFILICFFITNCIVEVVQEWKGFMCGIYYYEVEDFWKYKKDFDTLAKKFLDCFNSELEENENISYIIIEESFGEIRYQCFYESEYNSFDILSEYCEKADEKTKLCFDRVHKALRGTLSYGGFMNIRVSKNQVIFNVYGGPYHVIYSKNIFELGKQYSGYVIDRLAWGWYQVVSK